MAKMKWEDFVEGDGVVGDDADAAKTEVMYEGTGLYGGKSNVRVVNVATGEVLLERSLDGKYFGEGVAYYEVEEETGESDTSAAATKNMVGRLIQITWKEKTGFIYDARSLKQLEEFQYETSNGQGWGITHNGGTNEFYVTDGSYILMAWDATTRKETRRIEVTRRISSSDGDRTLRVSMLNEIEYDPTTDTILSNVWFQDVILRIDPSTGFVTTVYDLKDLFVDRPAKADVLNGIALVADHGTNPNQIWVTGKLWPYMYRIRLIDP